MPTYEYQCKKCGKTFELFQSMKDDPINECPETKCQEPAWGRGEVRRLLGTGAGLIFKGSGFYITDYRSDSYKQAAKAETGASSGSGTSSSASGSGGAPAAPSSSPASSSGSSGSGGSAGTSGSKSQT